MFGHHRLQTPPDFLFSVSANLKPALFQFGAKSFDVGLHPERNECLPVTDSSTVLAVQQNPASSEVVHATADRTKGNIRLLGEDAVRRVDEFGTNKNGHDGLDPTLLRATWGWVRLLGWLPAFHVNEQSRNLQMSVACEIEVVDLGAFQGRSLLGTDVRRKEQEPVANVVGRQSCHTAVQLIDDDADVLVTEMPFLFNKVANEPTGRLPCEHGVKAIMGSRWRTDRSLRHPPLKIGVVWLKDGRPGGRCHVLHTTVFINNEQDINMNTFELLSPLPVTPPT